MDARIGGITLDEDDPRLPGMFDRSDDRPRWTAVISFCPALRGTFFGMLRPISRSAIAWPTGP
ncbi:hypothetical protein AJ88_20960 [Mesorhizobium amorphae CCBAU 01583]|nr:hypothetical protein AJ88_20960 [Mesorhizobium amorphae CCBAU 01583]